MRYAEYQIARTFLIRADYGAELISFIGKVARENDIKVATFTAIGALKSAKLGYYDQEKHEYREISINSSCELANCLGNISLKDGQPFVHAHAVLADENGDAKAGHLVEGMVFAVEVFLQELKGSKLERQPDGVTGLALWEL